MTGIGRLRELGNDCVEHSWSEAGKRRGMLILEIADQIERELREERDRWDNELCEAQMDKTRVMAVYLEMNKHVLGHEGMEDSPVARWARELREALGGEEHDHADEREIIAWVRDHGGLEEVRRMFQDADSRRVELCAALDIDLDKGWSEAMAAMRIRLMPEGCEWPRFEDDAPVRLGDMALIDVEADMVEAVQLWIHGKPVIYGDGGSQQLERGERVKRPVADTWERLEEDARQLDIDLNDTTDDYPRMICCRDLVRRAKALAGVSE